MAVKNPPSNASHYMPYVVLGVLVALAIIGTRLMSIRSAPKTAKTENGPAKQGVQKPSNDEAVVGYHLPAKSRLGSIGAEKGLNAVIYGRKSDLEKVISNPAFGLILDAKPTESTAELMDHLTEKVEPSAGSSNAVAQGHVLLVLANSKQLIKLAEELQSTGSASTSLHSERATAGGGQVTLSPNHQLLVRVGSQDGVVMEATSSAAFDISFSTGGIKITSMNND
jgi:hypothetical protein